MPLPTDEAADSLAAAETAFAAHSIREDMRRAFIAHFAADGVFVRNGWVVARDDLGPRPAPPIVLDWRPQYVEAASSGDIGLSTGPWKLTSRDKPDTPAAYGQYVSIWTRAPGGPWQVRVDLGISNAGPALWDAPLVARASPTGANPETLAAAEAEFDRLSRAESAASAYRARAASDLRLYREGSPPAASRDAALASAPVGTRASWAPEHSDVARSGDFGYVYGRYALPPSAAVAGQYLRVWRREAAGWRVVMDVVNRTPGA
jgi:ketosteroid isomerase-like protein